MLGGGKLLVSLSLSDMHSLNHTALPLCLLAQLYVRIYVAKILNHKKKISQSDVAKQKLYQTSLRGLAAAAACAAPVAPPPARHALNKENEEEVAAAGAGAGGLRRK